jgi:hypothetical protein
MIEQLIKYETAILAKEVGLKPMLDSASNLTGYKITLFENKTPTNYHVHFSFPDQSEFLYAPTLSGLQKWLRDEHKIDVVVGSNYIGYNVVLWDRNENKTHEVLPSNLFQKYEEALEAGEVTSLNLIKNKI